MTFKIQIIIIFAVELVVAEAEEEVVVWLMVIATICTMAAAISLQRPHPLELLTQCGIAMAWGLASLLADR